MKLTETDKKNKMFDTLLQGKGNSRVRNMLADYLAGMDFVDGGCYSTSGVFRWEENSKGWKLSWGQRYNVAGKNIKYFTSYKYFKTEKAVLSFLRELKF